MTNKMINVKFNFSKGQTRYIENLEVGFVKTNLEMAREGSVNLYDYYNNVMNTMDQMLDEARDAHRNEIKDRDMRRAIKGTSKYDSGLASFVASRVWVAESIVKKLEKIKISIMVAAPIEVQMTPKQERMFHLYLRENNPVTGGYHQKDVDAIKAAGVEYDSTRGTLRIPRDVEFEVLMSLMFLGNRALLAKIETALTKW